MTETTNTAARACAIADAAHAAAAGDGAVVVQVDVDGLIRCDRRFHRMCRNCSKGKQHGER